MATLEIQLSKLDLNSNVVFAGARIRAYLNAPMPLGETRPWVELKVGRLTPETCYGVTARASLRVPSSQLLLVTENAQLGPGAHDLPTLVLQFFYATHNLVGQPCSTDQGSALLPLRRGIGTQTVVAFQSTYCHYNELASSILTSHGVMSSSSVACTVGLALKLDRPSARHCDQQRAPVPPQSAPLITSQIETRAGSPRICYSSEHIARGVASGREFTATVSEFYRPVARLRPVRRNLGEIQFASFVENGTVLPGYMFFNTLEPPVVEETVIERAALVAALAVRPVPVSTAADAIAALRGYVQSAFACANPTALFQNALQLPAVACTYIQDEVEIPSDFRSTGMTAESDHHRIGLTDTYSQLAISGTGDYNDAQASGDCEDKSDMTSFDMGMHAQAYVLTHFNDPDTELSHWVARGLAAVLFYVPFAALCSLDEANIDSHMVSVFVHRSIMPERFRVPPWGEVPFKPACNPAAMPAALYLDGTYYTPMLPMTPAKGAAEYSALFDCLVAGNRAVEGVINVTDQPWLARSNPAQRFVVARLFVDIRCLQTRPYQPGKSGATSWMRPVFDPHSSAHLAPMLVPTDKRHPGTYGISLMDLCQNGYKIAAFVPHVVPVRQWNEMLLCLAFRHPPVPIRLDASLVVVCVEATQLAEPTRQVDTGQNPSVFASARQATTAPAGPPAAASDARNIDLVYPVVVRTGSYTPQVEQRIKSNAAMAWPGKAYRTFRTRAVLNDVSGGVVVTSFVV